MASKVSPFTLDSLKSYTREEVQLWNWYCRCFPNQHDWKSWSSEIFEQLLERPAGQELCLVQSHSLQAAAPEKEHSFLKDEVRIGREPDNDVVLPSNSTSKQHARILLQSGQYFLEDVGSTLGTYKNKRKLAANQPILLKNGDQFAIFPYNFTVKIRQAWVPESQVEVYSGNVGSMDWKAFLEGAGVGMTSFAATVYPAGGTACLQVEQGFLEEVLIRLLHPLGVQPTRTGITPSDGGIFEFVMLSLLQRVNRQLAFPFQWVLGSCGCQPKLEPRSRGLVLAFSIALSQLKGTFRLFLPYELLAAMRQAVPTSADLSLSPRVSWPFTLSAGNVELTAEEIGLLEPSDVVLFDSVPEVLYPKNPSRGWKASLMADNPWAFKINNYFERSFLVEAKQYSEQEKDIQDTESTAMTGATPDLEQLPLLLHVVLGEKELTLTEVNGLVKGTILELEKSKTDPVDLAINGKLLGKGELVEVEGKLGVKILTWRAA